VCRGKEIFFIFPFLHYANDINLIKKTRKLKPNETKGKEIK
jgi:hypothetical protein